MSDSFTKSILKGIIAQFAQKKGFSSISKSSLDIFVDTILFYLSQIATEASNLARNYNKTTITTKEIETATKLILKGDLNKNAVSEGQSVPTESSGRGHPPPLGASSR